MPEPVPAPTAAQIVTLSDIVMETTDSVTTAVAADSDQDISNAKWVATLLDITAWGTYFSVGKQQKKKVGPLEWYEGSQISELDFRNKVRRRYGYDPLTTTQASFVISSLQWFGSSSCV